MRKLFFEALTAQDPNGAYRSDAGAAATCRSSGEAGLPSWVRKHEACPSKKAKPGFAARQKLKVTGTNRALVPASPSSKLLTVAEVAWLLNLSQKTVRRMIMCGNLAVIRIGRSIRIHPQVIEKIMRQNE